ncbi:hypothetical protein KEM52_006221 [Ascosphaera acerosa]|nr:hypothetical protein KEM52_006221 [Ascosphaera acerosa]
MATNGDASLNVPSLVTLAAVAYFLLRWLLRPDTQQGAATQADRDRRRIEQVNQIHQMFPQLDRRAIMWDLHRNGGSLTATTERILSGTGLEIPQQAPAAQAGAASASATAQPTPESPSLIARYNLADKVNAEGSEVPSSPSTTWAMNKSERQRLLQERRDAMILAARKRLLEKENAQASGSDPA